jgi:arabinose-5-phosphate isomerase
MPTDKKSYKQNPDVVLARAVLEAEVQGLKELGDSLDRKFVELVELIYKVKGRVIVSGMGKSGHIARKIAATLASTGTPAFFVHPGEASHGDLGMINGDDVVILLSNSGETKELIDIINYVERFRIPLVAFVRNVSSSLAQAADIAIIFPKTPEALEFDAPTTSTTMMLALGDAMAITLLEKKGFSKDDFGTFHPGGRLGAKFVKVGQLMHTGDEIPVGKLDDKMSKIIISMSEKSFGCICIINTKGEVEGIITDGNLRRHMSSNLLAMTAKEVMTKDPVTTSSDSLAVKALDLMNQKNITSLLVTEKGGKKIEGILHIHDCLRSGVNP